MILYHTQKINYTVSKMLTQHHKLKKINKCNENTLKTIDISYNRYALSTSFDCDIFLTINLHCNCIFCSHKKYFWKFFLAIVQSLTTTLSTGAVTSYPLMKIEFKQWWSTIPPISTKQTITSHLKSLNINKKANHLVFILLNAVCLAEKQQIPIFTNRSWSRLSTTLRQTC
jgi:hypothetical protein